MVVGLWFVLLRYCCCLVVDVLFDVSADGFVSLLLFCLVVLLLSSCGCGVVGLIVCCCGGVLLVRR